MTHIGLLGMHLGATWYVSNTLLNNLGLSVVVFTKNLLSNNVRVVTHYSVLNNYLYVALENY